MSQENTQQHTEQTEQPTEDKANKTVSYWTLCGGLFATGLAVGFITTVAANAMRSDSAN